MWFPTGLNCSPPNCLLNKAKTLLAMPRNLLPIFFFSRGFSHCNWQLAIGNASACRIHATLICFRPMHTCNFNCCTQSCSWLAGKLAMDGKQGGQRKGDTGFCRRRRSSKSILHSPPEIININCLMQTTAGALRAQFGSVHQCLYS